VVCALSGPPLVRAQQDAAVAGPTGSIAGTIVDVTTGRPISGVAVGINGTKDKTTTSDDGRFVFNGLGAGRYDLVAVKAGWGVPVDWEFGAPSSDRAVDLGSGERLTGLTIRLIRFATVSGYLRDSNGRPLVGMQVRLMAPRESDWSDQFGGVAYTDDRGLFRIVASAGRWLLYAHRWQTLDDKPVTRSPSSKTLLEPFFYPGVSDRARAAELTLAPGEDRSDISFQVAPVATFNLAGRVRDSHGTAVARLEMDLDDGGNDYRIASDNDGRFEFRDVLPGRHVIHIEPRQHLNATGVGEEWAREAVAVEDRDVRDLLITLRPPAHITGRVELIDGLETQLGTTAVMVCSPGDEGSLCGVRAEIAPDRTFRSEGLVPGRYEVRVFPSSGFVEDVQWGNRDVLRRSFTIAPDDTDAFLIRLTSKKPSTGTISGHVSSIETRHDIWVMAFPAARADWIDAARLSPTFRRVLVGPNGAYAIRELPPGQYLVCANDSVGTSRMWRGAKVLAWLAAQATLVVVSNDTATTRDLEMWHLPRSLLDDIGPSDDDTVVRTAVHTGEEVHLTSRAPGGTGRLAGRVISSDNGSPIVGAAITASSDAHEVEAMSDTLGRFELTGLPDGSYSVFMREPSFAPTAYGAASPGERGQQVVVRAGAEMPDLIIRSCRGAVISGRVRDANGQPVHAATVQITRRPAKTTERDDGLGYFRAGEFRFFETDDRGEYRAFGLAPGTYVVGAMVGHGDAFSDTDFDYWPSGRESHGAGDVLLRCGEERADINISLRKDGIRPFFVPTHR
jgi:protocatechuate 3,4-dioxygenase beta subunit